MHVDVFARRFFPAIVLTLVAVAAHLQANGVMQLVARAYLDEAPAADTVAAETSTATKPRRPPSFRARAKSSEPILSRNIFDSTKGPIEDAPKPNGEVRPAQVDFSNPLAVPICGGIQAHAITESTDPSWSTAVLQAEGDAFGRMHRRGDFVGDKEVAYVGYNPTKVSPAVWLLGGSALCQVLLFEQVPPAALGSVTTEGAVSAPPESKRGTVPPAIASRIRKASETEFHLDRTVVDDILDDQTQLMKAVRIVPEQKDGKVVGVRLFGIRPDTLLGILGMQNGDRLESINGFDVANPEKSLEAYAHLRAADKLTVQVNRRGQPLNIAFEIR